jgi:hypothetical protein
VPARASWLVSDELEHQRFALWHKLLISFHDYCLSK